MNKPTIRGVSKRDELNPRLDRRDVRPMGVRVAEAFERGEVLIGATGLFLVLMLMFPIVIEWLFLGALLFLWWAGSIARPALVRLPIGSGLMDIGDPKPGGNSPNKARGIVFMGNEMESGREVWFNKSDICTHVLLFGSTGAGKALKDDEPVLTPSGWKRIDALGRGDQVLTPDRQVATITGVFEQGMQALWRIDFDDGRWIEVTGDHLWGVAQIGESESWLSSPGPEDTQEVISTSEISARLFAGLGKGQRLAIPLTAAVGDAVVVWDRDAGDLAELARAALADEGEFPEDWIEGSVKQREQTWARVRRMGRQLADSVAFDSRNLAALRCVQRLAWSLGFFAMIEPWQDRHSLVVRTLGRWLAIRSVRPLGTEAPCRCIKISDRRGLFITRDWLVTHNTEALVSMAYTMLTMGSGFIYVDGKADNGLWARIFSIARTLGREDDLLVINYMTGGVDVTGPQKLKHSNTLNPFIVGSGAGLTELLVGLMEEAGGDGAMWKGRAVSLISSIMFALVHLRDRDGLLLDVDVIREHLLLENIQKLSKRHDIPTHAISALKAYLRSLPGYQEGAAKQSDTVMDQHGYLQMQFTRILGSLADTYGHIFRTNLGEVDFFDVVLNRRILVVMLPAMEKSIDELGNLGKIVVACLKQMMATGLGNVLEGSYADVIEAKPTNSPAPYMCILDEYGYYVVKGAAVMPAQARGLGFSMVFAGQDYPAFKKNNNAEEAVSTIGNCNIKMFMKLEDPTDTYDLAEKSIGKGNIGKSSGFTINQGMVNRYADQQNANVERRERVDWLDLKDHREGEAHMIFKSTLIRMDLFFAGMQNVKDMRLNSMLRVAPPALIEIQEQDEFLADLNHKIVSGDYLRDLTEDTLGSTPARLRIVSETCRNNASALEGGMAALAQIAAMSKNSAQSLASKTMGAGLDADSLVDDDDDDGGDDDGDGSAEDVLNIFRTDLDGAAGELLDHDTFRDGMREIERGMGGPDADGRSENIAADMRVISSYPRNPPEPMDADEFIEFIEELDERLNPQDR